MFDQSAAYYDLIYGTFKNYSEEAGKIRTLIHREHPGATTILDVACGTGEHARILADEFSVDGLDLEPAFVNIAQEKVKSGSFTVADMKDFDLGKQYDIVLCLFSSIGYLTQGEDVVRALQCFRRHLAPGGLIVVEPWFTPDQWFPGRVYLNPSQTEEVSICRMSHSSREGHISIIHFHYLVGRKTGVVHLEEVHRLGLYTVEEMLGFFDRAGLRATHDPQGLFDRGLYIARGG